MSSLKIKSEEFKVDTQTEVKGQFFRRSPSRKESAGLLFNRTATSKDIGTENMKDDLSRNQGSSVKF